MIFLKFHFLVKGDKMQKWNKFNVNEFNKWKSSKAIRSLVFINLSEVVVNVITMLEWSNESLQESN
jgi:hypothetical protein